MMDLTCKPRQRPDYRLEQLDDELLLYHPSQTVIMYCNPSASLIWQLCNGERTVEEIVTLLSTAYEQPGETITPEVTSALEQFHLYRAIEYVGEEDTRKSG
jgi:hypothetical protein